MSRSTSTAVLGLAMAAAGSAGLSAPASAQAPTNSQIDIAYVEPTNPAYEPLYQRLKVRQPLEELQQFLAPLKLPKKLLVQTKECGTTYVPVAAYKGGTANICYEYLDQIERLAPATTSADGVTRANAIAGAFVQDALHMVAEGIFNILQVPIWGREEDAADKIAGFIMMQFGKDVALTTLTGTAYFFEASNRTWTGVDFSDERSTEDQRFYNYLCIAYGGDPRTFGYLVQKNILPKSRAEGCYHEYTELQYAFVTTILPYVDPALLAQVRAQQWIKPDDGQYVPLPQSETNATPPGTADAPQH
jgi:Putative metallopeptidase